MSRSPSRDRSAARTGRTFAATAGGGGGGAFDPATISGKLLWLRGKDLAGANGASVTSWTDQSGQASNNPTAFAGVTVAAGVTPSGGKAVHGTGGGGSGTINLAAIPIGGGTTAEIWIVVRTITASEHQSWHFGSGADYYPFSGGGIYESFATTSRKNWTNSMALNTWRIYRNTVTGGVWTAYLDNHQEATASGQTFGFPATPKLMDSSGCDIAEVLLLNTISDATRITDLTGYFNTEHGLTVT